jgi:predicted sulfurtransferase
MFKYKKIKYLILILIFCSSISLLLFLKRDTFFADSDQEEVSYILIDIIQAKECYDEGTHLFIDARDEFLYSFGYIPNAVNLPLEKIDQLKIAFENKFSKNTKVIVYCNGPQCY